MSNSKNIKLNKVLPGARAFSPRDAHLWMQLERCDIQMWHIFTWHCDVAASFARKSVSTLSNCLPNIECLTRRDFKDITNITKTRKWSSIRLWRRICGPNFPGLVWTSQKVARISRPPNSTSQCRTAAAQAPFHRSQTHQETRPTRRWRTWPKPTASHSNHSCQMWTPMCLHTRGQPPVWTRAISAWRSRGSCLTIRLLRPSTAVSLSRRGAPIPHSATRPNKSKTF